MPAGGRRPQTASMSSRSPTEVFTLANAMPSPVLPIRLAVSSESAAPHRSNVALFPTHCSACKLRELCLPSGLGAAETKRIGDLVYTRKRVKRGEALIRAGSSFESLYAVRSGFFKTNVILEDGRDQVAGFHMAGELVGFDGIGTGTHDADVVALEDSEVCIIPEANLGQPELQRQLHKLMSRELVRDHGILTLLGSMNSEERLAAFLHDLSQRFLARGFSASEFHLRMTRDEIGSFLGLSLETVSRLFSRFADEGLVAVQQRHIRILDMTRLRAAMFPHHD